MVEFGQKDNIKSISIEDLTTIVEANLVKADAVVLKELAEEVERRRTKAETNRDEAESQGNDEKADNYDNMTKKYRKLKRLIDEKIKDINTKEAGKKALVDLAEKLANLKELQEKLKTDKPSEEDFGLVIAATSESIAFLLSLAQDLAEKNTPSNPAAEKKVTPPPTPEQKAEYQANKHRFGLLRRVYRSAARLAPNILRNQDISKRRELYDDVSDVFDIVGLDMGELKMRNTINTFFDQGEVDDEKLNKLKPQTKLELMAIAKFLHDIGVVPNLEPSFVLEKGKKLGSSGGSDITISDAQADQYNKIAQNLKTRYESSDKDVSNKFKDYFDDKHRQAFFRKVFGTDASTPVALAQSQVVASEAVLAAAAVTGQPAEVPKPATVEAPKAPETIISLDKLLNILGLKQEDYDNISFPLNLMNNIYMAQALNVLDSNTILAIINDDAKKGMLILYKTDDDAMKQKITKWANAQKK